MARDLRQLGVLAAQEGVLRFADDIAAAPELNLAIQSRVVVALKRHRVYSLLVSLSPGGARLPLTTFGDALPKAYPAVAAKRSTWLNYARAFAHWFGFAGLASMERDEVSVGAAAAAHMDLTIPGKRRLMRGFTVFPRCPVGPVLELLRRLSARRVPGDSSTTRKALADARVLGFVSDEKAGARLTQEGLGVAKATGQARAALLRKAVAGQQSVRIAERILTKDPGASPISIGREVAREVGIDWSDATASWNGKSLRGWMRASGFKTAPRPRSGVASKVWP
jgi:hypothetical protein